MAKKKQAAVQVTKHDPKREKTIQNRIKRLERHLKKFENDAVAATALKREKPARKKSGVKGNFPKQVVRITESVSRVSGKVVKPGSGFVSSKHAQGSVIGNR